MYKKNVYKNKKNHHQTEKNLSPDDNAVLKACKK